MKRISTAAQVLLGIIFLVFGLNGFFHFIPDFPVPERAGAFIGALLSTGYLFKLLKSVEILSGALLLVGWYVPLALIFLAPIIVNIDLFHFFLAPAGLPIAFAMTGLELYLLWHYRAQFGSILSRKPSY